MADAQTEAKKIMDNASKNATLEEQKTAYEIGTGDWSSDVCSSDLDFLPGE